MSTENNARMIRKNELIDKLQGVDGNNPSEEEALAALELGLLLVEIAIEEVFYGKTQNPKD